MFNDKYGLTKAVLEGRKTQTRRIITYPRKYKGIDVWGLFAYRRMSDNAIVELCMYDEDESSVDEGQIVPKYKVGEIVAVAQSYETIQKSLPYSERSKFYCDVMKAHFPNSATHKDYYEIAGWHNKMFVKAELMIHQIRITNVRIERLQDISEEDCLKEGVVISESRIKGGVRMYYPCRYLESCAKKNGWGRVFDTPQKAFASLIDKVGKEGDWDKNPYVFVYDFELVK